MLAGAVVAVGVQQPLLVVVIAFLSHFFMDVMPHFGVLESDTPERNKHPLFRSILVIDIVLAVALLALLPFALQGVISWWVLLLGMVFAWIPDTIWVKHYLRDRHGVKREAMGWLSSFHQKIQWFEKPIGLVVEVLWLGAMGILLGLSVA